VTFLNLFSKKQTTEPHEKDEKDETDVIGSVTFYVRKTKDDIYLDLHISDYEEETLQKFAKILSGLASIKLQLETMNMLKNCFEGEDVKIFEQIVGYVLENTQKDSEQLEKINKERSRREDQPWIKPSEIVQ